MTESICLCRGQDADPRHTGDWTHEGFCVRCGGSIFREHKPMEMDVPMPELRDAYIPDLPETKTAYGQLSEVLGELRSINQQLSILIEQGRNDDRRN